MTVLLTASWMSFKNLKTNMIKTELYSAPSPGFLMLLNDTTLTKLLKPKTYISALLPHLLLLPTCNPSASPANSTPQTYPKSIHLATSVRSYNNSLLTDPLTSAFTNHNHPALTHGLLFIWQL